MDRRKFVVPEEYIRALEGVLRKRNPNVRLDEVSGQESNGARLFLKEIASSVAKISEGLTTERDAFTRLQYLSDPKLSQAYLLYYMTANLMKLWSPLRELELGGFFQRNQNRISILDLGSGTGTAIWGLLLFLRNELQSKVQVDFVLTDAIERNVRTSKEFFLALKAELPNAGAIAGAWARVDLGQKNWRENIEAKAPFSIITMMNVLNELPESGDRALIDDVLGLMQPEGVCILVEPATRELSRRALRFRDAVRQKNAFIYAPCVRKGDCPALTESGNWCHTEVGWERPDFIEVIDDIVGTLRLSLKHTYFVFGKQDRNLADSFFPERDFEHSARIVSEVFHERGRLRAWLCNDEGRNEYMMNLRDETETNRSLSQAERYDLVQMDNVEIREHYRKIAIDTVLNRLVGASGARIVDNP